MPRELTLCCFGDNIKWLLLKVCLRAREPFSFEHLHREEKGMNHVVKAVVFMGKTVLFIIALLCAAWLATFIYIVKTYGIPEGAMFALASASIPSIIYGMTQQQRRRQQHRR